MKINCPICGKLVTRNGNDKNENNFFPFCSERCRLIDLGAWLDAEYKIPVSEEAGDEEAGGE